MLNQANHLDRTITSTRGLAIKGGMAKPARHEAFAHGRIKGNNMTLVFKSRSRVQISPRKWKVEEYVRFVSCQRKFSPSGADYWWEGVRQHTTVF